MSDFYLRTKKDPNDPLQSAQVNQFFFGDGTNDLQVDTNGDFALIQGTKNLDQSMAKILVTARNSSVFFPSYGSLLQSFVGQKIEFDFLKASVQSEIVDTLRIYQFINKTNPSLDEQIDTLESLKVTQLDNLSIQADLTVITKSNIRVGTTIQLGSI